MPLAGEDGRADGGFVDLLDLPTSLFQVQAGAEPGWFMDCTLMEVFCFFSSRRAYCIMSYLDEKILLSSHTSIQRLPFSSFGLAK